MSKGKSKAKDKTYSDQQPALIPDDEKVSKKDALMDLEQEIVAESIKIAQNETSSCYELVEKTKELIALRKARGVE